MSQINAGKVRTGTLWYSHCDAVDLALRFLWVVSTEGNDYWFNGEKDNSPLFS
jgi:hypothetical protein